MMFGRFRVETIGGELVLAAGNPEVVGVDVTATAPRIRQIEQVHRRAEAKPSSA